MALERRLRPRVAHTWPLSDPATPSPLFVSPCPRGSAHASYFRVSSHAAAREMLRVMSDPHARRRIGEQGPTSRPVPPPPALLFATRADQADLFHKLSTSTHSI